jgi:hypothetical protein
MPLAAPHPLRERRLRLRSSLELRARVLAHRGSLDRLLAAGADPSWAPELRIRAAQITDPRWRRALATGFANAVCEAHAAPRWSCRVPLNRVAVRAAAPELRALTASLRLGAAPAAQGVALASQLLRDPCSPLYLEGGPETLRAGAEIARQALDLEVDQSVD